MRGCCWAAKRRDLAGLAEEALLALRAGKPVYLIGAFGGCAEAVIEAPRGNKPGALRLDYQFAIASPVPQ